MESKQRTTSYSATFKRKLIAYGSSRNWQYLQLTQAERNSLTLAKENILTLKYRFWSSFMKGGRMGSL